MTGITYVLFDILKTF